MKITKTWAKKMLKAVNEVVGRYKKGERNDGGDACPLCITANDDCKVCPWVVFTKHSCLGLYMDDMTIGSEYTADSYKSKTIPKRLPRLYGWRKRLTNIIERKG